MKELAKWPFCQFFIIIFPSFNRATVRSRKFDDIFGSHKPKRDWLLKLFRKSFDNRSIMHWKQKIFHDPTWCIADKGNHRLVGEKVRSAWLSSIARSTERSLFYCQATKQEMEEEEKGCGANELVLRTEYVIHIWCRQFSTPVNCVYIHERIN